MKASEYQKLAMRTKGNIFTDRELMLNAALGLAGEISEYTTEGFDFKSELGDIQWYVALMCEVCGLDLDDITEIGSLKEKRTIQQQKTQLLILSGNACDHVKKVYFQGHELDKHKMSYFLINIQRNIFNICDGNFEEIWQLNIDKLLKRYPDGFKSEDSVNREA